MFVLPSFIRAATAPAARLMHKLRNRRAVTRLGALDERALKDIGLTRSDVLGALAAPLTQDPSLILAEHARGGVEVPCARKITSVCVPRPLTA